jgi:large repetitive protein
MRAAILLPLLLSLGCTAKPDTGGTDDCTWYQDADGDGYGDASSLREGDCGAVPEGWSSAATDCDDQDSTVHPGALERCDLRDNDCDGFVDDDDPDVDLTDAPLWYPDMDADGYGDQERPTAACAQPDGLLAQGGDCDDTQALVHPDASERCNGADDDCDGTIDEDAGDASTYYLDEDADGYGDPLATTRACSLPPGASEDATDCDDTRADVNPGALELCDAVDNDCDDVVDEDDAVDAPAWYGDADMDGYGDPATVTHSCDQPAGHTGDATDCDDTRDDVHPWADEFCDGVDNNCDGIIDEDDAVDAPTWHADADGDGWGDPATSGPSCEAPAGWLASSLASDCDDSDADINPEATVVCDGIDNDCDGLVDDDDPTLDADTASTWYADGDADGYGDYGVASQACVQPSGQVSDSSDCDDSDAAIHPAASEICDDTDNDCDGLVDDDDPDVDTSTGTTWYADTDGDGYGDPTSATAACDTPSDHVDVSLATDCDDGDADINPVATEICDGDDNDCDSLVDEDDPSLDSGTLISWYTDADADGYGDPAVSSEACEQPTGMVASSADCDDGDASINPAATEDCDGIDNDCDGLVDDDDPDAAGGAWFADDDLDGYGDPSDTISACEEPSGYVSDSDDCDDSDWNINPDASETCDGEDDDCDGSVDDAAGCPCYAETYDGTGYLFCTSSRTWDYADRLYQGYGYLLVSVSDASEQAWLVSTAASYSSSSWWIGANDQSSEGSWRWDSGESFSYSNWGSGQPDNGSYSEDCGNMAGYGSGLWNDEQCWTSLYAIYEAH